MSISYKHVDHVDHVRKSMCYHTIVVLCAPRVPPPVPYATLLLCTGTIACITLAHAYTGIYRIPDTPPVYVLGVVHELLPNILTVKVR